jgi:nicotinamide phosphoribosyltransferase
MKNESINPMLLCDFYKTVHAEMLPDGITKSMSYYTPRMSRVNRWDSVVMFGLQMFCKTWLIDYFNQNFFGVPENDVVSEYERVLKATLGSNVVHSEKIRKLHRLGYLPIEIDSLPEGTLVPVHVPMFGITNTHPDFAWLPQALESLISAEMWYPQITATVGHTYREIVNKYYSETCEDGIQRSRALGAFDFRGDMCFDAALKAGAGWCLSFLNTATVPVIPYLERMFNCDCTKEPVAYGAVSTEHFVMCSNFAVDGNQEDFLRRMLTKLYPDTSFSCVLDS